MKSTIVKIISQSKYILSLFILMMIIIFASIISPSFLRVSNIITIIRQASILLILSSGLTVVVLTGGIDLSVNAVAGLVGCIAAQLMVREASILTAVLAGLLVGIITGMLNGILVSLLHLPPFIATYGTSMVVSGLAVMVMRGQVIYGLPDRFVYVGIGWLYGIPVPVIIAIVVVAILFIVLKKTIFGRNVYMIGSNIYAAKYSGMRDVRLLITVYVISGITAAIGGLIMAARLNAADANMGNAYGLQVVAAVVIGGTSMFGGEGGMAGTVIGAMVLTIIANLMNLVGLSSFLQPSAVGAIIIIMVSIDIMLKSKVEEISAASVTKKT